MQIKEIETILRENPNFDLIWIPSSEKQHQVLLNRLRKQSQSLVSSFETGNRTKYNKAKQQVGFVRGVVMVGEADNRLSNRKQRESAIIIEKNVSAEKFDKFCSQLSDDLIIRIFC